jgi:hypothetical protein
MEPRKHFFLRCVILITSYSLHPRVALQQLQNSILRHLAVSHLFNGPETDPLLSFWRPSVFYYFFFVNEALLQGGSKPAAARCGTDESIVCSGSRQADLRWKR